MARSPRGHRKKPKVETSAESAVRDHEKRRTSRIELVCWVVLFAAAVGALVWKHCALFFYSWTDEQIHLYVAQRMAEGAVLYRDIDSARPPLALFPIVWLIRMGCSPLLAGRALVLGSQFATAGLVLWGGWRLVSWRAGALAALLFLTSPEIFDRVHYTGIQLGALTTCACVLFSLRAQPFRSGLFFGLTLATDQHGLVVCGIVAALPLVRRPRDAVRFAAGASVVSGIVFGGVWAMGGRHFWESLIGHHLYHLSSGQGGNAQFWEKFTPWLYEHAYLFMGAGLGLALLGFKRREVASEKLANTSSQSVRMLLLVVSAHLAVVMAMTEAAFLYIVVITPLLTLLAGIGFDATAVWWSERRRLFQARSGSASRLIVTGTAVGIALTAAGWAAASSYREGLDERKYSFWPHVLHGQVSRLQQLDVAWQVARDSTFPRTGTIFGDPTIVSAVALHSGLRVSGELADLNPGWIEAGTVSRDEVVSRIERDGVAAVITSPWFMVQDAYFRSYLMACYEIPKIFAPPDSGPGAGLFDILVYHHTPGTSPCHVPRR
jgi:hypothetical protein